MLVRALRLTDKLGGAGLRVAVWGAEWLIGLIYDVRMGLIGVFTAAGGIVSRRSAAQADPEVRRAVMARKAAEAATRTIVVEDPLKTQNRALSVFTMVLIMALIGLIGWFTTRTDTRQTIGGGAPIVLVTPQPPTITPTITTTATLPPDPLRVSGSIVYTLRREGRDNIYAFTIGSANPVRLTNTPSDDRDPIWSPDGRKIAFASRRDGSWELYVLDLTNGVTTRLTYSPDYKASPTWSPDGSFLAFESYNTANLDIYIVPADASSEPQRLTYNPAPDYSPSWSPGLGRQIAYVSLRDGNPEIYVINLGQVDEDRALRLTNTPAFENYPTWSPDGETIAYSAVGGNDFEGVFAKSAEQGGAQAVTIGRGREPAWSPDGRSLLFALDSGGQTTLVGGQFGTAGVSATAITLSARASGLSWNATILPDSLISSGGAPANDQPLFSEQISGQAANPPFYSLRPISVTAPSALLSDRVDDAFVALREAVSRNAGVDFLGNLEDAFWDAARLPEPGQNRQDWHYTGRAFSFDRNLVFNTPPPIEIIREDIGINTYWRVYVRVAESAQNGTLGEPLKQIPWDFDARRTDPVAFEQGGKLKSNIPGGYYIDFTQLAEDYGWTRTPSGRNWRSNYSSIFYWKYTRADNLTWDQAMLEVFTPEQLTTFLTGPTPIPTAEPRPTEEATPITRRTATPIPPA